MNSTFAAYYIDSFINSTSHCTTGDAKQIPIIIPSSEELSTCEKMFNRIITLKQQEILFKKSKEIKSQINSLEKSLDQFVNELYAI